MEPRKPALPWEQSNAARRGVLLRRRDGDDSDSPSGAASDSPLSLGEAQSHLRQVKAPRYRRLSHHALHVSERLATDDVGKKYAARGQVHLYSVDHLAAR